MAWWAWMAVGTLLLVSELAFVDAQFYLVFVGAAALVTGCVDVAVLAPAEWLQWLIFAVLAVFFMVGFRRRLYERLRRNLPPMNRGPVGDVMVVTETLEPGASARIDYRGSSWSAVNAGSAAIMAGARARIERVDGLTLVIRSI